MTRTLNTKPLLNPIHSDTPRTFDRPRIQVKPEEIEDIIHHSVSYELLPRNSLARDSVCQPAPDLASNCNYLAQLDMDVLKDVATVRYIV